MGNSTNHEQKVQISTIICLKEHLFFKDYKQFYEKAVKIFQNEIFLLLLVVYVEL